MGNHQLPDSQSVEVLHISQANKQNGNGSCGGHQSSSCNVTGFLHSKY